MSVCPVSVIKQTASLSLLVHNTFVSHVNACALAGAFKIYQFNADGCASLSGTSSTPSVLAGEINGSFTQSRTKTSRLLERQNWFWQVMLTFPDRVDLETFKATLEEGLTVPINKDGLGNPTIFLDCLEYDVIPPVQEQGSAQGTKALYRFNASVSRSR